MTESPAAYTRLLKWEATFNTRDLGGYPALPTGRTRWGALVRSDSTALLKPPGQQAAIAYGIRTVVDMRFPDELERSPSPFARPTVGAPDAPDYLNIPLDVDLDIDLARGRAARIMSDLYIRLLETNRKFAAAVLTAIARARPGGVLVHCHAGKDRTGLIAALTLGAVGAPAEAIIMDYAFTTPAMEQRRELQNVSMNRKDRAYYGVLSTNLPETMDLTLVYLQRRFGGVQGYLRTTPLLPEDLARLRERLVENGPVVFRPS